MGASAEQEVIARVEGAVGVVTIHRPRALNALSLGVMEALAQRLRAFDGDAGIRAMVLAGSPKAFAAGADIGEMKDLADAESAQKALSAHLARWDEIALLKKPLIAAVSGFALGGGCELALACDMIVASETAVFGQPETLIGVIPGAGGTQRLTKLVGRALAMEMNLTGRRLNAREALSLGLVNRVVPVEATLDSAIQLAQLIASGPPLAVCAAKEAVRRAVDLPLAEGLALERRSFFRLFDTQDQKEGMQSFAQKRKPVWTGT
ncbi:MAG: enoyl-CoA hydratase-related protein [Elusimicrobiota bacterium]